jgi:hypothetical protein
MSYNSNCVSLSNSSRCIIYQISRNYVFILLLYILLLVSYPLRILTQSTTVPLLRGAATQRTLMVRHRMPAQSPRVRLARIASMLCRVPFRTTHRLNCSRHCHRVVAVYSYMPVAGNIRHCKHFGSFRSATWIYMLFLRHSSVQIFVALSRMRAKSALNVW